MKKSVIKFLLAIEAKYYPGYRLIVLLITDIFAFFISAIIPLKIYLSNQNNYFQDYLWIVYLIMFLGPILFIASKNYTSFTRYINSNFLYQIVLNNILLVLLISLIGYLLNFDSPNLLFWILLIITSSSFISFFRILQRDILLYLRAQTQKHISIKIDSIAIYGAGMAGALLQNSLRKSPANNVFTFIDDDPKLYKRTINGTPVCSPDKLKELVERKVVNKIMLAIPSLSKKRLSEIVKEIKDLDAKFLQVPSILDITSGRANIDSLRPIDIEDLLGRPIVEPDLNLLGPNIKNKIVCVSGAGGSIGSELCREIIKLNPKKLLIIDNSEIALYSINKELEDLSSEQRKIIPILGDVCNYELIKKVFIENSVQIVFHAAAYKHVPLLQKNYFVGLSNNIRSTKNLASIVDEIKAEQMVLISSDKAVRPTNIMGASKRISELIIKAFSNKNKDIYDKKSYPIYSMVRFGNVLGSSGSVVPLFKKQIMEGGPITLTNKNIIRYFMTIKEAAQLVLQSSVLAVGGDLFLLDMGEPVKIYDLAVQMIKLSGLSVKDDKNGDGDIEIVCNGLRPGEKLYEELLVTGKSEKTSHPLIFKEKETTENFQFEELINKIELLEYSISNFQREKFISIIKDLVPEWDSSSLRN